MPAYLEIEVHDVVLVHVFYALAYLPHVGDTVCLRELVILLYQSVKQLTAAQPEK